MFFFVIFVIYFSKIILTQYWFKVFQYARGNLKMRFRRLPLGLPCVPDLNDSMDDDDEDAEGNVANVKRNVKKLRYFGNILLKCFNNINICWFY